MVKQVEHIRRTVEGKPYIAGTYPITIDQFIEMKCIGIDRLTEDMVYYRDFEVTTEPIKKLGYGFRSRLSKFENGYVIYLDYILPKQSGYIFEVYVPDLETAKGIMKKIATDIISLNAFGRRVGYKTLRGCILDLKNTWGAKFLKCIGL